MSGTSWTEVLNAPSFFGTSEKVYVRWLNVSPNGNTVYALASIKYYDQGILLKSTNGGNSWFRTNSTVDGQGISLAIDPTNSNTLYLGTWNGVYRSEDGGYTWQSINNGLPSSWEFLLSQVDH